MAILSPDKLRRFADAEEKGSSAAGAVGINAALLDIHRLGEAKEARHRAEKVTARKRKHARTALAKTK